MSAPLTVVEAVDGLRADLTPEEIADLTERLTDLYGRGYVEIPEDRWIRPGVRVRHVGEQYHDAYTVGTGNVRLIFKRHNPAFEHRWGYPDIELVVLRDKPRFGSSRLSFLAQYHVAEVSR